MKSIFKYFLSSIITLLSISGFSQDKPSLVKSARLGIDLSQPIVHLFEPERMGIGAALDIELKNNFFVVLEGGWLKYDLNTLSYHYQLNGMFGSVGFDYNLLKKELKVDHDILFIGLRYAGSSYKHQTSNMEFTNYWGTFSGSLEEQELFAQWIEVVGGIKAELFFAKNLFIGWTIRAKKLISGSNNSILEPYIIPGYGKTDKKFRFGISWFIAYRIPFKK